MVAALAVPSAGGRAGGKAARWAASRAASWAAAREAKLAEKWAARLDGVLAWARVVSETG